MISKKEVEHVANLAHLKLSEEENEVFIEQLAEILNYIEKLNELDTDDVQATAYTVPMNNVFREDKVEQSISREKLLANAPEKKEGHFRVPQIIAD